MDPATTEIYTLSLHDALPISRGGPSGELASVRRARPVPRALLAQVVRPWRRSSERSGTDRKSTRLNSSHTVISYAVFCLKKKTKYQSRRNEQRQNKQHDTRK